MGVDTLVAQSVKEGHLISFILLILVNTPLSFPHHFFLLSGTVEVGGRKEMGSLRWVGTIAPEAHV